MKTKILAAFGLGLALLLGQRVANAQNSVAFDVQAKNGPVDGFWHVLVQEEGSSNTYDIFYQASQTAPPPPASPANTVNISFFNALGVQILNASVPGDATLFTSTSGNQTPYFTGSALPVADDWQPSLATTTNAKWQSMSLATNLATDGSNFLEGKVTLASGNAVFVTATVQDGHVWESGNEFFTPEAGSFALLLPGLIPVAFAVRKRRKSQA